jgi:hypothetical protein
MDVYHVIRITLQNAVSIVTYNRYVCGSVTNNSTTRVRIGYWIYSLWRFITATDYNYYELFSTRTGSSLDPTDGTVLH